MRFYVSFVGQVYKSSVFSRARLLKLVRHDQERLVDRSSDLKK